MVTRQESKNHVIYITNACNLRCRYCYEANSRGNNKMTTAAATKALAKIFKQYERGPHFAVKIHIFGGEPLLNWPVVCHILEVLEQYRQDGYGVIALLTTNATLLKPDKVRHLFKYREFLNLEISIDGDKEAQDHSRCFAGKGASSHAIVAKNARFALQYFPQTIGRPVIARVDLFAQSVAYLYGLGFRRFCLQAERTGQDMDEAYCNAFSDGYQSVLRFLKGKRYVSIDAVEFPQGSPEEISRRNERIALSEAGDSLFYVTPDGDTIEQALYTEKPFNHF